MTYKDHFVVEVKCNGKILRVKDDTVTLPFGSEYSLLLKNLNSKRAVIKISIDGQDVLDNISLVLNANETFELQGFLRGNVAKNRFKFIQKTKEIQDHRGDKIDDGIVRVEFAFEEQVYIPYFRDYNWPCRDIIVRENHHHYHYFSDFTPQYNKHDIYYSNTTDNSISCSSLSSLRGTGQVLEKSFQPNEDEGITVKGSEINQQFDYTTVGSLSKSEVIIIKLRGETQTGEVVQKPVTVDTKLECKTCGKKSSSANKFCPNCGTFLEV